MDATLTTDDGLALHVHHWPATAPARGSIVLVHGLGEHVMRYRHVAEHLNRAGWHVVGHDHRGHGRSGGARGALRHGDDLLRDLAPVIDAARARGPGPLLLLGHSLGGQIAARFAAEGAAATPAPWFRPLDAVVLSSPALDPGMNPFQKALLAVAGPLAPDLAVHNGLKPAWISRDPQVVQAYAADPLVHSRVTPKLVRFLLDAAALVQRRAPQWSVPTLLMWAGSDRCVAPRGSAAFAAAAPRERVAAHEFPALFHEIFNEPEQREVFDVLDTWLATLKS